MKGRKACRCNTIAIGITAVGQIAIGRVVFEADNPIERVFPRENLL